MDRDNKQKPIVSLKAEPIWANITRSARENSGMPARSNRTKFSKFSYRRVSKFRGKSKKMQPSRILVQFTPHEREIGCKHRGFEYDSKYSSTFQAVEEVGALKIVSNSLYFSLL